jgi:hypothetical protein
MKYLYLTPKEKFIKNRISFKLKEKFGHTKSCQPQECFFFNFASLIRIIDKRHSIG